MSKYKFKGLSEAEVKASIKEHGLNTLPEPEVETFWEKLMDNFEDPLIKILCVALAITVFLAFLGYAEWFEGFGIAVAVFLATFVATYSEFKNESSFRDLQLKASTTESHVFRDGKITKVPITHVLYGDLVLLQAGDKVPADGPLIAGSLGASQASITGEPEAARKRYTNERTLETTDPANPYYLLRGSLVEEGEGVMLVNKIGSKTLYGSILKDVSETDERESPLTVKLSELADSISTIGYIGATAIFFSFLFKQFFLDQGFSLDKTWLYVQQWQVALHDTVTALILAIIIIVVAVPEGLPMMIAIVLALNMQKLLDENVLVRRLLGIETAGSLNILFTDKTGTITRGHLETHQVVSGQGESYSSINQMPKALRDILTFSLKHSTASHVTSDGTIVGGNSSDKAFLAFLDKDDLAEEEDVTRESEVLFSSILKFAATSVTVSEDVKSKYSKHFFSNRNLVSIFKGAPEKLIPHCTKQFTDDGKVVSISDSQRRAISKQVDVMSRTGIRVIALTTTHRELPQESASLVLSPKMMRGSANRNEPTETEEMQSDIDKAEGLLDCELTLVGLVGLRDEVRPESKEAISLAKSAGIQVVMITGDKKETAISVAREVGLLEPAQNAEDEGSDSNLPHGAVLVSSDLRNLTNEELQALMPNVVVIARALPTDKSRLVQVCQSMNKVVGMTGDGVNDAAALHRADVGFAMGLSGTDMAKEASDIVILDDNFNSITQSILYGRTIFRSIRKFIIFQSTINVASTMLVFLGPFIGFDFPLTLIQLLWVNLVMDTLAALAFGGEPALKSYMTEKPIRRNEAIISPYMWSSLLVNGVFIALFSIGFLVHPYFRSFFARDGVPSTDAFLTGFFAFYIFITSINAFNVRTHKINIFENITNNRGFISVLTLIFAVQIVFTIIGGKFLRTIPLTISEWGFVIALSFVIIPWDMIRKILIVPFLPKKFKDTTGLDDGREKEKED